MISPKRSKCILQTYKPLALKLRSGYILEIVACRSASAARVQWLDKEKGPSIDPALQVRFDLLVPFRPKRLAESSDEDRSVAA